MKIINIQNNQNMINQNKNSPINEPKKNDFSMPFK